MEEVYVLAVMRTPIVGKNGRFRTVRPELLGAKVLKALQNRCGFTQPDGILGGNAVGTGGNITRLMSLLAGWDSSVPACTIDMQCASAAAALSLAYAKLASGQGDIWIAGGMESASLQPVRIYAAQDERHGLTPGRDGRYTTAQFSPGDMAPDTMLRGAERVAVSEGITRQELEAWALRSHRRAAEAAARGIFEDILVSVNGWAKDDGIRPHMRQQLLDRLPPLLGEGTGLTAGTACCINDGAAFAVLVSGSYAKKTGCRPLAKIIGTAAVGGNPAESPRGAMRTADILLERLGLCHEQLAAIEYNEAFAVIDVLFERVHPDCLSRYNRFGGALAYGHPYGASGVVLLGQLIKSLEAAGGGKGILSIAGAGGMGEAIALELVE